MTKIGIKHTLRIPAGSSRSHSSALASFSLPHRDGRKLLVQHNRQMFSHKKANPLFVIMEKGCFGASKKCTSNSTLRLEADTNQNVMNDIMAWHAAVKDGELSEGEVMGVEIAGKYLALYKFDGYVFATSNICTHEVAFLSDGFLEHGYIECPLHAARFDIKTGAVLCAPATEPIATYSTKLENGQIFVELPERD